MNRMAVMCLLMPEGLGDIPHINYHSFLTYQRTGKDGTHNFVNIQGEAVLLKPVSK